MKRALCPLFPAVLRRSLAVRPMRQPVRVMAAAAVAVMLAGCALPGPERPGPSPENTLPAQWPRAAAVADTAAAPAAATQTAAALPWQDFVRDAELRSLVARALQHNRDLRLAVLAIEQSRAQLQLRAADLLPTVSLAASGTRQTSTDTIKSSYSAGLAVPSLSAWEIDLFGRLSSLQDVARAQLQASEQSRLTVQTQLVASVAAAWLNVQTDDALIALTRQTLEAREESQRLVARRVELGASSLVDQKAAESATASARAALAQQLRQRQLDANALTLLVGQPVAEPLALPSRDGAALATNLEALAPLPVNLPSSVLLQRPDVRAAELQLQAAQAQIGAARAAFLPRILLTTSVGSASADLAGLFKAGSWGWTLAPQALMPLFDAGRNQANLEAARASRDAAVAQYDKAIQTAFREVMDGLDGSAALAAQQAAQQALVQVETERLRLADLRLRQGVANQLDLLDAQRSLFAAQQALVQTRAASALNRVALFKALGAAWQHEK